MHNSTSHLLIPVNSLFHLIWLCLTHLLHLFLLILSSHHTSVPDFLFWFMNGEEINSSPSYLSLGCFLPPLSSSPTFSSPLLRTQLNRRRTVGQRGAEGGLDDRTGEERTHTSCPLMTVQALRTKVQVTAILLLLLLHPCPLLPLPPPRFACLCKCP